MRVIVYEGRQFVNVEYFLARLLDLSTPLKHLKFFSQWMLN